MFSDFYLCFLFLIQRSTLRSIRHCRFHNGFIDLSVDFNGTFISNITLSSVATTFNATSVLSYHTLEFLYNVKMLVLCYPSSYRFPLASVLNFNGKNTYIPSWSCLAVSPHTRTLKMRVRTSIDIGDSDRFNNNPINVRIVDATYRR